MNIILGRVELRACGKHPFEGREKLFSVLYEMRHDDQVDCPVASIEEDKHQGEDVRGRTVERQLESSQSVLKSSSKLVQI